MLNEVLENIKSRRSVRTYTEQQVSAENLNLILEAATYAPSGMNYQTWHFTAIQDADILRELNEKIKGAFAKSDEPRLQERGHSETYCCYYHAPTLVIVSNEPTQWWAGMDCACAIENMFLAAHSLGIGSCWINQLGTTCDDPEVREYITSLGNFKSLLFYFGLLSIKGVDMMGRPILHIPNLVVREQLFNFLIQGYARHDIFKLDVNRLRTLFENMSFKGDWKPLFEFLAEAIREQSRIREYIEGEAHIKGFLLAYLSMFRYYQLYPEYEMNKGFADFFFKPSPAAPVSPPYTYLLEVKYAKAGASEKEIRALADDAREQLIRYSKDECVAEAREKGGLKLATIVWRSWELVLMEEVS